MFLSVPEEGKSRQLPCQELVYIFSQFLESSSAEKQTMKIDTHVVFCEASSLCDLVIVDRKLLREILLRLWYNEKIIHATILQTSQSCGIDGCLHTNLQYSRPLRRPYGWNRDDKFHGRFF